MLFFIKSDVAMERLTGVYSSDLRTTETTVQ